MHNGCNMAKFRLASIRVYAWLFFVLVVFVPVSLGLKVISQLNGAGFRTRILTGIAVQMPASAAETFDITPVVNLIGTVHHPLVVLFLVILGGSGAALVLFLRHFVTPMESMVRTAGRIAGGQLKASMPAYRCTEIRRLKESYEELSVNLQEILLLTWNLTRHSSALLDRMSDNGPARPDTGASEPVHRNIALVRGELQTLESMIRSFDLYDVRFEKNRIMAANEPCSAMD